MSKLFAFVFVALVALSACSGGGKSPPPPPPCDELCQDNTAIRGMREMVKLAFNVTLQGKPVGDHDQTAPCPLGGTVRVVGNATSNPVQGSTFVTLTYTFTDCKYLSKDPTPEQNYDLTLNGTMTENGTLAVQPTATTSLQLKSDSMDLTGTVYDPPNDYKADKCPVVLAQDGGRVSGTICGRDVGVTL